MSLNKLAKQAKKMLSDNSPVILTALGVTGTITTAYLAAKGAFRAQEALLMEDKKRTATAPADAEVPVLTTKEIVGLTWKFYVPAVVSGATTITCIIGANYIGTKKAAALAAAVTFSEKALEEYQTKTKELLGPEQEAVIRKEIEQDRKDAKAPLAVFLGNDDVLFLDAYSGRYFQCNKEKIRRALNDINYQILHSDWATVSDFWDKVGLEPTSTSDEEGWNIEHPLEIEFGCHETPDGKPCMSYEFMVVPVRTPWQLDRL
jgi:hypothetical protein